MKKYEKGTPLISIVIAYDRDRGFLSDAVTSAKSQDFRHGFEVVTEQGYNIRSINVNNGVKRARGQYIKLLDEDDLLTHDCLSILYHGIDDHDWCCADGQSFGDITQTYRGEKPTLERMLEHNRIFGGSMLYHKRCFTETGGFDEGLVTGEEYEFNLRLMSLNYTFIYIPRVVYRMREHGARKSQELLMSVPERRAYIQKIRDRFK